MRLPLFFTAFFLGLYSGSQFSNTHPIFPFLALITILAGCHITAKRTYNTITIAAALFFVLFGFIWMSEMPSWPTPLTLANTAGGKDVAIIGRASSETIVTRSGRLLPLKLELVQEYSSSDNGSSNPYQWTREYGNILVKVTRQFNAVPGSRFLIHGSIDISNSQLTGPVNLRYRPRAVIVPISGSQDITLIGPPGPLSQFINGLKYHLLSHLAWGISNPEDELIAGITFGRKGRRFDGNWSADFYDSGLSHLIVASGAQVSILFMPLFFLLGRSGLKNSLRWVFLIVLAIALTGFAQLLGGEPSILRASLMGCVLLLAIGLGRKTSGLAALSAAGFFWLIVNPLLVHDVSFLLSFAASFGIIYLAPSFFTLVPRNKKTLQSDKKVRFSLSQIPVLLLTSFRRLTGFIINIALVTIAAQIGVFPALACTVGRISLSGIFSNLLAVPIAQIILYIGAFSAVGGFISPVIPMMLNNILGMLAELLMKLAGFFSCIPYASVPIDPLPGWFAFLWYALMFLIIESRVWFRQPYKNNST